MQGWRRLRIAAALAVALCVAACTTPPASTPSDDDGTPAAASAPAAQGLRLPRLRPLQVLPALPPGAPPVSAVPSVRYDLSIPGTGLPDDGVPGDEPPREIFERGGASWYGIQFHQRKTANGERFDMSAFTAAHRTLPFNTRVCVRSLVNGREVLVRINDRGPYASGRIIDLSQAAADAIDMVGQGIKQVALSVVDASSRRCAGKEIDPEADPLDVAEPAVREAPTLRRASGWGRTATKPAAREVPARDRR